MANSPLHGLRALVTGAGSGLGQATAIALGRAGVRVFLTSRRLEPLTETLARIDSDLVAGYAICDLADAAAVEEVVEAAGRAFEAIELLINNACPWLLGAMDKLSPEQVRNTTQAGLTGTLQLTHGLLPMLEKGEGPHIVNIISVSGAPHLSARPETSSVPFIAAKLGQHGMNEALREELRPKGIRVTGMYPGLISVHSDIDDPIKPARPGRGRMMSNAEVVEVLMFCLERRKNLNLDNVVITSPFSEYAR